MEEEPVQAEGGEGEPENRKRKRSYIRYILTTGKDPTLDESTSPELDSPTDSIPRSHNSLVDSVDDLQGTWTGDGKTPTAQPETDVATVRRPDSVSTSPTGSAITESTYVSDCVSPKSDKNFNSPITAEFVNSETTKPREGKDIVVNPETIPKSVGGCPSIFLHADHQGPMPDITSSTMPTPLPLSSKSINTMVQQGTQFDIQKVSKTSPRKVENANNVNGRIGAVPVSLSGISQPFTVHLTADHHDGPRHALKKAKMNNTDSLVTKMDERPKLTMQESSANSRSGEPPAKDEMEKRRRRFLRTHDALEKSGLMGITMKTADLMKNNMMLGKQICDLKQETAELLRSIFNNPENKMLRNELLHGVVQKNSHKGRSEKTHTL